MIDSAAVLTDLTDFVSRELLEGKSEGLDENTPLLQWGIINSLSLARLVEYTERRFGVKVPPKDLVPENFQSLRAVTQLVSRLGG